MDDLLDSFDGSTTLVSYADDVNITHPRVHKLKNGIILSQNERRERFLDQQQLKHQNYIQHVRALASNSSKGNDDKMECNKSKTYFGGHKRFDSRYANQLMVAEWMVEKPDDLETNWVMVPCPVGKRCLVISANGKTRAYNKNGNILCNYFQSVLPGGNCGLNSVNRTPPKNECCILDCILNLSYKTYYVLDVMAWGGQVFYDCDTEFRGFWLMSKFDEFQKGDEKSFKFLPLQRYGPGLTTTLISDHLSKYKSQCKRVSNEKDPSYKASTAPSLDSNIKTNLSKKQDFILDGVLFFHKDAHYILPPQCTKTEDNEMDTSYENSNPLVGWLSLEHLPKLLNITLPFL